MSDIPPDRQRLELLKRIEKNRQQTWEAEGVFQAEADGIISENDKYFGTFCYPYMNGTLHLGHAFTLSKTEFACAYQRLCGKNVLFPQGFHGSGMPIKACADKVANGDVAQIKSLLDMGIMESDISKFADAKYWLEYFPECAKTDIKAMGCGVDWRRSFVTTDVNPHYDSFVRWQFETLLAQGKLYKDVKMVIFSPKDDQPCADHDRQIGEGIRPIQVSKRCRKVDLDYIKTTLIMESDNGVGEYHAYDGYENDIIIITDSYIVASNLFYQKKLPCLQPINTFSREFINTLDTYDTDIMITYLIPDGQVISRSGDQCVVALVDQWFIDYGESEWRDSTEKALSMMEVGGDEVRHGFEESLKWLGPWACSRSKGLGTCLPCDPVYLIDSLSDSTAYMAFYTVSHIVQQYPPEHFTKDVWDFILLEGALPKSHIFEESILQTLKSEFNYWYPLDLRVSGKDLINNHLTFCIYNHTALWSNDRTKWPRSFKCNGHITLNGQKMAKSWGNFMTLKHALQEYGADALRLTLAECGHGIDDADFKHDNANASILRLTKELAWVQDIITTSTLRKEGAADTFFDKLFMNDINACVIGAKSAYNALQFRDALKCSWHDMLSARDRYRCACVNNQMHIDMIHLFIETLCKILAPICPHFCDYIWRVVLMNEPSIFKSGWPKSSPVCAVLIESAKYLQLQIQRARKVLSKKDMQGTLKLIVASDYTDWQKELINKMCVGTENWMSYVLAIVRPYFLGMEDAAIMASVLPFAKCIIANKLIMFDEYTVLHSNLDYIKHMLKVDHIELVKDQISGKLRVGTPLIL